MMREPGRNEPCPCGSGAKYKRCCLDRDQASGASESDDVPSSAAGTADGDDTALTLVIETDDGIALRRVPDASPLADGVEQGIAAEDAVQDAAALWGLPDFVYRPAVQARASGVREIGDGILIVGRLAVVIQVKCRVAFSSDPAKEQRWIEKMMRDAIRQAHGTIRSLRERPTELVNARGRRLLVDGKEYRWVSCVVIDHPDIPDGTMTVDESGTMVLLRRDWEFLFEQLKSTHAVASYLERALGESLELGQESARYYEFARADAAAPPEVLDPALTRGGSGTVSTPLLPLAPAATEDRLAHRVVRSLFEDIATTRTDAGDGEFLLTALAELDRLPVGYRGEIGQFLLDALQKVARAKPPETLWEFRSLRGPAGRAHLAFGAATRFSEEIQTGFTAWVHLKHHDMRQLTGDEDLTTVGVLFTPRRDGHRPWDTSMSAVQGDIGLTEEDLASYRELWPNDGQALAA